MKNADHGLVPQNALDVIVIGEALIDVVSSPGGTIEHPGGSPANVAYGLGRLGVAAGLLTAIGDDERGVAIAEHLRRAGVLLLPGSQRLERTSTSTVTLTGDGAANYEFDVAWELDPVAPALVPKVVHTGSIATFLQPGAGAVKELLQHWRGDCTITYDPNIRPSLLGSHTEALSIFEDLIHLTDVVKLSDEDAKWLYPREDVDGIATRLLSMGAGLAVITQGPQGSLLATASNRVNVPSVESLVADTIGAGDSYTSALIMGLITRGTYALAPGDLEHLGRTASMAAAITVRRPGANPPTIEELGIHLEEPATF